VGILALLVQSAACWACPLCRDSVAVSGGAGGDGGSTSLFNGSVITILIAFLVIVAFLAIKIVRTIREVDRLPASAT
jgi:hypothetical protein